MFGCLRRVGCLVLLLLLAVAAWFTRARWQPMVFGRAAPPSAARWEPVRALTDDSRAAVAALARKSGPAFTDLTASQAVAFLIESAGSNLPASLDGVEARVTGDQLAVQGTVDLASLKALDALGPLGGMVSGPQRLQLAGTLQVVRSGLGEFRVERATVGDIALPSAAIPRLLSQFSKGRRPPGLSPNGVPLRLPDYVGDMRIARGRLTLYRNVP